MLVGHSRDLQEKALCMTFSHQNVALDSVSVMIKQHKSQHSVSMFHQQSQNMSTMLLTYTTSQVKAMSLITVLIAIAISTHSMKH